MAISEVNRREGMVSDVSALKRQYFQQNVSNMSKQAN